MANVNTDLTEEDAADLQFPKEAHSFPSSFEMREFDAVCKKCANSLIAPYILCNICKIKLCTWCFSQGVELFNHTNDHDYHVIRDDFPIFSNTDWTAREELALLNSIQYYGNWNLVAKDIPNRSPAEIKHHYDHFYLTGHGSKHLALFKDIEAALFIEPAVPYRLKILDTDDPPRYKPETIGYQSLAGYNSIRSEFESEFDSNAEDLLSNLKMIDKDDPHCEMLTNLQCAIVKSYNRRLRERQRWKKIIRDHGLLVLRKLHAWLHRYDLTITRPVYEKLVRFMQFYKPFDFEMMMEGLHRSGELKIQILRFYELRQKGITALADARLYLKLKQVHEDCELDLKAFYANPVLNIKALNVPISLQMPKRKPGFTPIDIIGMPGYEKLTVAERELCKTIRLVPITYLELKEILIGENQKMGSLKLKTARKMLKIDVNKTRRLYDFMVKEGYISNSP